LFTYISPLHHPGPGDTFT